MDSKESQPETIGKNLSNSITTSEALVRLHNTRQLSTHKRLFQSMRVGSLRSVVIMWIRICSGIGLLTLPYYCKQFGLIEGAIVIAAAACLNYLPAKDIFQAVSDSGKTKYPELIEHYFGRKMRRIFDFSYTIDMFSQILLLQVACYNCLQYIMYMTKITDGHPEWFSNIERLEFNEYNRDILIIRTVFIVTVTLLLVPFFLKDNLRDYKTITYTYLTLLFLLVAFLVGQAPFFVQNLPPSKRTVQFFKPFKMENISNFGGIMLSFYVQPYVFSLYEELVEPNLRRLFKIAKIATFFEFVGLSTIALIGYYSLGDEYTPYVFFLRTPYEGVNMIVEWCFRITVILFFFSMIVGIPMYNPSLKTQIYDLLMIDYPTNSQKRYVSLIPLFIASLLSILYPHVTSIFNIVATTVCNLNGYLLPTAMKLKREVQNGNVHFSSCLLMSFYIVFGVLGMISLFN